MDVTVGLLDLARLKVMHQLPLLLTSLLPSVLLGATAQRCKIYPSDSTWPSAATWQTLNETVFGRLAIPTALAAACQPGSPSFNNLTCYAVAAQWQNTSWVAESAYLADYNDVSCPPDPALPCTTAGYPAYIIEAETASDIQAGVNFAREHDIRLIIKGTGHDWPGRSSGTGSLSIWTHKIRGIEVVKDDPLASKYGGVASVKIAAGMRWREIYAEMAEQNLTVVGGADPNVGVGGWTLNGGHSPISSLYGMGADQVLSLDVVTANGQYLTVNETSHADLFWALRGGGGSTYAVMVSMTVKAYPVLSGILHNYYLVTSADSDTFWSMVAYFHTQIPTISEAGGMGYHYVIPGSSLGDPTLAGNYIFGGIWLFPNKTESHVNGTLEPLYTSMQTADWAVDPIIISGNNTFFPDYSAYWAKMTSEDGGMSGRLGSWLLDAEGVSNFTALKTQLRAAVPQPWNMISHVIAGPGVRNAGDDLPGGSNAVLPAWRKAYTHIVLPRVWPTGNETVKQYLATELRESAMPALKALSPSSGAYINECDPTNLDWKHDYFGSNYERLLEVKHKYDPNGVFWCKPCVGWDEWEIVDGPNEEDVVEWGVGQGSGWLCKKG